MAIALAPVFKKAYYSLILFGALYLVFVLALTFPPVQRNAIYAHRVNPTLWQNLSNVEAFGFLHYQVQPFTLLTPDHETLYAWHILPLHLAHQHAAELVADHDFRVKTSDQVLDTLSFRLLASDPNAHVIVNFHGNAGHLASSYRPFTYQRLLGLSSPRRPVHVIAFDYRGFGLSTGHPTESGLITDATSILTFLTGLQLTSNSQAPVVVAPPPDTLSIPPQNLILTSQSLGTAISTALLHTWTLTNRLPPPRSLILTSPFSSLPSLIDSYSIKGVIPPLLSPFRSYTWLMRQITAYIADTWRTDNRLAELLSSDLDLPLNIEILHARDDAEIPWWEAQRLWNTMVDAVPPGRDDHPVAAAEEGARGPHVQTWQSSPTAAPQHSKSARFTRTRHGGHNRLACSEEMAAAVWRGLELGR